MGGKQNCRNPKPYALNRYSSDSASVQKSKGPGYRGEERTRATSGNERLWGLGFRASPSLVEVLGCMGECSSIQRI